MRDAQHVASSSQRTPPTQSTTRHRSRTRTRRHRRATTIAFVLALAAPYLVSVSASPVPVPPCVLSVAHTHAHHPSLSSPPPLSLARSSTHARTSTTAHPSPHDHDPQGAFGSPDDQPLNGTSWKSAVVGTLSLLQSQLQPRADAWQNPHSPPEPRWPQFELAHMGMYHLPAGYVVLRQSMNPGFIVLSYLISFVGSICTLELLIRRTSNRGLANIVLLASAGICFGSVSTFAMHFVGNQSLALHHPDQATDDSIPNIYLSYQGGYTVLSLVASCLAMTLAFFVMGTNMRGIRWRWWRRSLISDAERQRRASANSHATSHASSSRTEGEFNPWKIHKARLRKSANVSTIFQQAGMMPSWSIAEPNRRNSSVSGWRDLVPFFDRRRPSASVLEPATPTTHGPLDEDALVRNSKELSELEFRYGRVAVRDELERRALLMGTRRQSMPMAMQTTPDDTPVGSVNSIRQVQMLQIHNPKDPWPPSSPLASYYHPAGTQPNPPPPAYRSPSPAFDPGYSFPPRAPDSTTNLINSTTNLLPHNEPLPPPPTPPAGMGPSVVTSNGIPPAILYTGRRASLPAINPPFAGRVTNTLSRIQSLPETDVDTAPTSPCIGSNGSAHHTDGAAAKRTSYPSNSRKHVSSSGSSSDATTGEGYETSLYDENEQLDHPIEEAGWRQRLRLKIQAGLPLTRLEQAQRFLGLDVVTWTEVLKIFVTGMVAGWGVAAMHYIGQVSINDIPYIAYKIGYVVGSVVIASGAVIIALYIMFIMLRPKLKHSWLSKIAVAVILGGAVCGMHYSAMMGTIYGWEANKRPSASQAMSGTKRAITGIVSALAFMACLGVTAFIVINSIRDRKERARRRRVVVASVLLDDQGRMLVNAIDGILPMCDIASLTMDDATKKRLGDGASSIETSGLGVDLTTHSEAFLQAMKMSWSWRNPFWSSLNPFAAASDVMSPNLSDPASSPQVPPSTPLPPTTPVPGTLQHRESVVTMGSVSGMTVLTRLNIVRFLEKFAVSATQLSVRLTGMQDGLGRLGVLYDQILTTGWVRLRNGKDTVSKGQLIFLVRRVTSDQERSDLLSRHFIFADATSVATSLHKTLSTPFDRVLYFLEDMKTFCDKTMRMALRPNTLYAGVAVVQATPFDGLRILLNEKARSQLPMCEVCTFSTLPGLPVDVADGLGLAGTLAEIGEAVTWLDGMSPLSVMTRNMTPSSSNIGGPRVGRLLFALERAIVPLLDGLLSQEDMAYILPRLTLHPVLVPLTPGAPARPGHSGWPAPHIIVFYANFDVTVSSFADKWLPFSLFRAQNEFVMASAVDKITRAAEAAAAGAQPLPSPASSPAALTQDLPRRPSKVQFEVPPFAGYAFPPKEGSLGPAGARAVPRRSSLNKTRLYDVDPMSMSTPAPPLPSAMASEQRQPSGGVAPWDPNWLINLLRTRLRADA